jgi:predicted TIM-barrel fold metal-dependent hydrolase
MTELLDAHLHLWDPAARHHDWLAGIRRCGGGSGQKTSTGIATS